jgi:cytochrome b561
LIVIAQYLVLAIVLAVTLNHHNRFVRAAGSLLVAIGLAFIVLSVYLADTDGTFAALPAGALRPKLLNLQAGTALIAIVFLLWASWRQLRRELTANVPWRNSTSTYGLISRGAHWATATLVLCLIPIGLFMQTLPATSSERSVFVAVHETLGLTVLVLVLARIAWLGHSAPPPLSATLQRWERFLARVMHPTGYALIILLPLTGLMLTIFNGIPFDFYGRVVPLSGATTAPHAAIWLKLHDLVLPTLFYVFIALHLGAVLKHHFIARRTEDVRRMLR